MKHKFLYKKSCGVLCFVVLFCLSYISAETLDTPIWSENFSSYKREKPKNSNKTSIIKKAGPRKASENSSPVVKKSYSDYFIYLGTSVLRRRDMEKAVFFGKTFTFGIGRKDWNYKELRINLRALKKDARSEIIHAELLPRLFYSFPVMGLTSYAGLGLGIGFSPFKKPKKTVSVNAQLFTGVKATTIYRGLGCFVEMNLTYLTLPFFNKGFGSFFNERNEFFDALLNAGIIYNF